MTTGVDRDLLEAGVRARCDASDFDGAATLALRGYGGEIDSFLVALPRGGANASAPRRA